MTPTTQPREEVAAEPVSAVPRIDLTNYDRVDQRCLGVLLVMTRSDVVIDVGAMPMRDAHPEFLDLLTEATIAGAEVVLAGDPSSDLSDWLREFRSRVAAYRVRPQLRVVKP